MIWRVLLFMGYSWRGTEAYGMRICILAAICLIAGTGAKALAAEPQQHAPPAAIEAAPRLHGEPLRHPLDPQHPRTCFNSVETREKIASRRLGEPFRLLRGAAGRIQGEALRVKLCRVDEDYVYDISVLRRDGRLVHVFLNAINGQAMGALNDR
jgi:hypothetical protein